MTDAFINIIVDPGAVSPVAEQLRAINEVSDVHVVTGEHDVVAQLELDEKDDLARVVADEIHAVTGVVDTVTNVAFEP